MMRRLVSAAALAGSLLAGEVWAANSVEVESRYMGAGQVGGLIHIKIINDGTLNGLMVPLAIRELTPGAYITSLKLGYGDRFSGAGSPLSDATFNRTYPVPDGTCGPGGFKTYGPNDTLPHPVLASPEGLVFARVALYVTNFLQPGADVTGSLVLTVNTTTTPGQFEIDTACVDPTNHLVFALSSQPEPIVPSFFKGTITIASDLPPVAVCHSTTVASGPNCDAMASIENGSYDPEGLPITIVQEPPGPYPLGQTTVSLIVTDTYGFKDTCQGLVTVTRGSANPPIARCHDVAVGYAVGGEAFASIDNGSYDPDGDPITLTQVPKGPYPLGQTLVKLIVSDGTCGLDSCQATVTVAPGMCNGAPVDVNCDGIIDVFDVIAAIDAVFNNGGEALSPCCVSKP